MRDDLDRMADNPNGRRKRTESPLRRGIQGDVLCVICHFSVVSCVSSVAYCVSQTIR